MLQSSSVKDKSGSKHPSEKSAESSSFKQIIRGVESLINDDEDGTVSSFDSGEVQRPSTTLKKHMTNGQKLQSLMKNPEVREKISLYLRNNGFMETFPILKVSIRKHSRKDKQAQLSEDDLFQAFKRFDNLEKVIIKPTGIYVLFSDHHSAYFAQKALNDIQLEQLQSKLYVHWCQPSQYIYLSECLNMQRTASITCPQPATSVASNPKFTCRYQIQIDNQKEFQVARKIIGTKGYNMKRIIDSCLGELGADPRAQVDSIKLRLRGKGSGYKQGPNKLESGQPLHLCISCRDQAAYNKACRLVQELLKGVYKQYKAFCLKNNRKVEQLSVRKLDLGENHSTRQSFYNFDNHSTLSQGCYQTERISQTQIKAYIEARNKARRQLNFLEADRIRNYLKSRGVALIDEKGGRGRGVEVTTWRFNN